MGRLGSTVSVECLTLRFCSGHDLMAVKWSPTLGPTLSMKSA